MDEKVHFKIALPEDLMAALEAKAKENERSKSGEIVFRLRQTFQREAETAQP